jgi:hypothetical protein
MQGINLNGGSSLRAVLSLGMIVCCAALGFRKNPSHRLFLEESPPFDNIYLVPITLSKDIVEDTLIVEGVRAAPLRSDMKFVCCYHAFWLWHSATNPAMQQRNDNERIPYRMNRKFITRRYILWTSCVVSWPI